MRCPVCKDGVLEEEEELSLKCPKCGVSFSLNESGSAASTPTSSQDTSSTHGSDVLESNVLSDRTGSSAEGQQRKRKSEVPEEKPAKQKPICTENVSDSSAEIADVATSALENLTLLKEEGPEQQVEGHDAVATRPEQPATALEDAGKKVTQKVDSASQASSGPETENPCESERPLKEPDFSGVVHPTVGADSKQVTKVKENGGSQLGDNNTNTASEQFEGDGHLSKDEGGSDGSDENDSELEDDNLNPPKDEAVPPAGKKQKLSKSQRKKEKKKERKKRKEEEEKKHAAS